MAAVRRIDMTVGGRYRTTGLDVLDEETDSESPVPECSPWRREELGLVFGGGTSKVGASDMVRLFDLLS